MRCASPERSVPSTSSSAVTSSLHPWRPPWRASLGRSTGSSFTGSRRGPARAGSSSAPWRGQPLVTAVSRHTRRLFLSWARNAPEKVKVLPNTVDERFHPGPKPAELISHYGLTGKTVLLTVSRLAAAERYKGHDRVIQALARLLPAHPDLVYVIAGDGDDRSHLEALATEAGVRDSVRFVGHVPDEDLPALYRAADVFVMPSTGEGFGIVFLQAFASGVPVIGGAGDGSRGPLTDGEDGALVSSCVADGVARAIEYELRFDRGEPETERFFERSRFQGFLAKILKDLHLSSGGQVEGLTTTERESSIMDAHG